MLPKNLAARRRLGLVAGVASAFLALGAPHASAAVTAGTLHCQVGAGVGLLVIEEQRLLCTFHSNRGRPAEHYHGHVNKFGLEVGVTAGSIIVWAVIAATEYAPGSLAGVYVGASAEASAIFGVGANLLVGGSNKSVALQPLSVQGQVGVDIGLGISELKLEPR
jgi:hypothetical protein